MEPFRLAFRLEEKTHLPSHSFRCGVLPSFISGLQSTLGRKLSIFYSIDAERKRRGKNCSTTTCCSSQLSVSSSKIGYLFTTSVMFFFASLFLMFYYFFCRSWRKFSRLTGGSWLPSRILRQSFRYGVQHGCRKFMEKVKYLAS